MRARPRAPAPAASSDVPPPRVGRGRWLAAAGALLVLIALAIVYASGQRETAQLARLVDEARLHQGVEYLAAHPGLTERSPQAAYLAAILHRRLDQPEQFADALRAAERQGLPRSDLDFQNFLVRVQAGDVPAEEIPKRLGTGITDEQQEDAFDAMTRGCLRTFQIRAAQDLTQRWLKVRPKSIAARLHQARAFELQEDLPRATQTLEEVLQQQPGHYEATVELATLLLLQSQLMRAEQLLTGIEDKHRQDARLNLLLAQIERRGGKTDEARARLEKLSLDALSQVDQAQVLKLLGQLRFDTEDFEGAAQSLQQAAQLASRDPELRQSLAAALAATGDAEGAAAERQKAKEVQAAQERLLDAMRAVRSRPNDPDARVVQAQALWAADSKSAALGVLRSVLLNHPNHAGAKALYAELTGGDKANDSNADGSPPQ